MRYSLLAMSVAVTTTLMACQPQTSSTETASKAEEIAAENMTDAQKQAYGMGASMGLFVSNRAQQHEEVGSTLDQSALQQGFADGVNGTLKFSMEEVQQYAQAGEQVLRSKQQEIADAAAQENVAKGQAYLAENATREGVTTTASGLQYEVLQAGEGASPVATDTVRVHYRGTLIDGTEFDSSYSRGEPAVFPLNRVITGWTEGVQLMKEGAKYRFHIPSELAYGERATGSITPNSTLIFDVELLEVVKAEVTE